MKKILFLAVALLGLTFLQGMSKPATPHPITYTQPDGTTITLRLCGDEFHHYYITEDGKYVTLCDDGYFRYTTVNAQNQLEASNIQVGNATTYSIGRARCRCNIAQGVAQGASRIEGAECQGTHHTYAQSRRKSQSSQ